MSPDPLVDIRDVSKHFGAFAAVDRVTLAISAGEFFSLLGPSGCGKTTLLRMLAGFETPGSGAILIGGRDVTGEPPYRRPVNLVFQHYALFPHLSVERNVAFGLRYQGLRGAEADQRVREALTSVQLEGLERRMPHQLSGGQKQRVALARALVLRPQVLLLDEPLGALDQKLRREMQVELKHLQRHLGITFVFVTHDQEEALLMSDRIAVMNAGRVEQVGVASEVFERPQTPFVARFMGAGNFIKCGDGTIIVRPEKLRLRREAPSVDGVVCRPVTIVERMYQGLATTWSVRLEDGTVLSVYEQNAEPFLSAAGMQPGEKATVCWDAKHAVRMQ